MHANQVFFIAGSKNLQLIGPICSEYGFLDKNWTRSCAKSVGIAKNRSTQNFERYNIEIVNTVSKPKK